MFKLLCVCFSLFLCISCTANVKDTVQEMQETSSETIEETIRKKPCNVGYSENTVLLSDPFFASLFLDASSLSYSYSTFYTAAHRHGESARIFVSLDDTINASQTDFFANNEELSDSYAPLSSKEFFYAVEAERLILSPLYMLFGRSHIKDIYERRSICGNSKPKILETTGLQRNDDFISIEYSHAVAQLAKDIAEQIKIKRASFVQKEYDPRLYVFTSEIFIDNKRILEVFLRTLYAYAPDISVDMFHMQNDENDTDKIEETLKNSNTQEDMVLLYLGKYTNRILRFLAHDSIQFNMNNVFYISDWEHASISFERMIPVEKMAKAWVEGSIDIIFQNQNVSSAQIHRNNHVK